MDDDWTQRAACRNEDPERFYDLSGNFEQIVRDLRKLCYSCPVMADCHAYIDWLEDGLPQSLCHGFWAGETVKERVRRRKERPSQTGSLAALQEAS